jgi:hypothetical protein
MTKPKKPYEMKGAAKYYFDLAGELRVENTKLLIELNLFIQAWDKGVLPDPADVNRARTLVNG